MRSSPASFSPAARLSRPIAFVVSAMFGRGSNAATPAMMSLMSLRVRGSPPVNRTWSTPNFSTAMRTKRTISSPDIAESRDMNSTPSSGMQYVQRRLQKSVSEMRRSRARRSKVSSRASSLCAVNSSPGSTVGVLSTGMGRPIFSIASSSLKSVSISSSHDYCEDAS